MPAEPVTVDRPEHPLPALATFELSDYRRDLESALAALPARDRIRSRLAARLVAVVAEQDDRAKIRAAR